MVVCGRSCGASGLLKLMGVAMSLYWLYSCCFQECLNCGVDVLVDGGSNCLCSCRLWMISSNGVVSKNCRYCSTELMWIILLLI